MLWGALVRKGTSSLFTSIAASHCSLLQLVFVGSGSYMCSVSRRPISLGGGG